jgi:hypothetical protein
LVSKLRENELLYSSHLPLGVPNGLVIHHASSSFSGAVAGEEEEDFCEGSFRTHILYFVLLLCFTLFILLASVFIKNTKKLESLVVVISLLSFIMLIPKYVLEDLSVGSGSIIGKSNIEEFFNHISMHEEVEEKSWVELAPSIEVASVCLIDMLVTRFASLNPICNTCSLSFLKLRIPKRNLLSWKLCA